MTWRQLNQNFDAMQILEYTLVVCINFTFMLPCIVIDFFLITNQTH